MFLSMFKRFEIFSSFFSFLVSFSIDLEFFCFYFSYLTSSLLGSLKKIIKNLIKLSVIFYPTSAYAAALKRLYPFLGPYQNDEA